MMNEYIAYSYKTYSNIIKKIFWKLQSINVHSFSLKSIELSAILIDDIKYVDRYVVIKLDKVIF